MKRLTKIGVILLIIAVSMFSGFYILSTPRTKSMNVPDKEFSAERAMKTVEVVARVPHPTGSKENYDVRDYLINELKSIGLNPEIQRTYVKYRLEKFNSEAEGMVENILTRIEGTGEGEKALLLCAHYDSTPYGPGAGDDASGVAAIIETLRAVKNDNQYKNDIIILISDGEEMGMLGAEGFAKEHPYINEVGFVINFETRGNRGTSLMFETGEGNSKYINEYKKSVSYPVTFSLMYDVYKWMPNATDFSIFKGMGIDGLNFAFIDGIESYHKDSDTPENLSRGSLQHTGENMLSLTRYFGNADLSEITNTNINSVYFTIFRGHLISYSYKWIPFLTFIGIGLFFSALFIGIRKKCASVKGIIIGLLFSILTISIIVLVTMGIWAVLKNLIFKANALDEYEYYKNIVNPLVSTIILSGFIVLASIIIALFAKIYCRWFKHFDIILGGMGVWTLLMIASSVMAKGFSYLFTWTLILASISMIGVFVTDEKGFEDIKHIAAFFIITFTTGLIFTPIIYIFLKALSIDMVFIHVAVFSIPALVLIPFGIRTIFTKDILVGVDNKINIEGEVRL